MNEPLADEVRSLLDGHIVLSRRLAERGHYPAIDVLATLSRVFPVVTSHEHRQLAAILRRCLALYQEVELLIRIGEYQRGVDTDTDKALIPIRIFAHFCDKVRMKYADPSYS
ncbi:type III secretion system ATPase [Salmonella enterica subsp. enterica]|uniref:Type III secretion system ATPase n=1 Tax=Salmonella enterica I TaxID=59201 RepID=A0A379WUS8_SALET|nr:type III secretion system ATPase [Salmonella enterica subsp. enterica]